MIQQPGSIQVTPSQLQSPDFPKVCAVTGEPSETWHTVNGTQLPVTRTASRKLRALRWIGSVALFYVVASIAAAILRPFPAAVTQTANSIFTFLGTLSLFVWFASWGRRRQTAPVIVFKPNDGTQAEPVMEIRNANPRFYGAVQHYLVGQAGTSMAESVTAEQYSPIEQYSGPTGLEGKD